ncbi:acyl-CoA carboxylase subunit epsilon [Sediminivirga luteola]|nr:acyl-CoA carboxylase subunit epsilon [Sediminivirga luteola]
MNLTTRGADETERLAIVAALSAVYARAAAAGGEAATDVAPVRRWARPRLRGGLGRGPGAWRSSGGWRR